MRPFLFPALALLAALPASAKPTPAEWKRLENDLRAAWAGNDGDARVKAVEAVGAADCLEGAKLLVQVLNAPDPGLLAAEAARDRFEPEYMEALDRLTKIAKKNNNMVPVAENDLYLKKEKEWNEHNERVKSLSGSQDAIAEALGKTKDPDAAKWLANDALKDKSWRTRAAVAAALGVSPADGSLVNAALLGAVKDSDARVRAAAIEALGRRGWKDAVAAILAAMKDDSWQVRVAAAESLAKLQPREAVGPLIARLQEEQGRLREDIDRALKAITGVSFKGDPLGWKGWWELNGAAWDKGELAKKEEPKDPAPGPNGKPADPKAGGGTTTFYGIETKSKNLIFVVDVSGSMAEPASAGWKPDVDSGKGGGAPQGPKGNRKIDVARWELARAINLLPEDAKFNIITFSTDLKVYSPTKMLVATKAVKAQAVAFAEKLEPDAGTNIHDALEKAFELAGAGPNKADANFKDGVDTIFFMTDGMPTVGKSTDGVKIADLVKKWNAIRRIRIHCVGVGTHAEDLLKRLADESGGTYVKR
jgi:HEAT repeat protein